MINPYEILNLEEDCTTDDIKHAYRTLSKQYHPDVNNGDSTKFMELSLAYKVLSDTEKRRLYDEQGIVMDDNPNHIDHLVNNRLAMIANHWIDAMMANHSVPIQKFVVDNLDKGISQINKKSSGLSNAKVRLKDISKRLKHKSENNIIQKMIQQRINTINKGRAQNEKEIEIINLVKKMILEYEYEEEVMSYISNASTFSSTTNTTTFGG